MRRSREGRFLRSLARRASPVTAGAERPGTSGRSLEALEGGAAFIPQVLERQMDVLQGHPIARQGRHPDQRVAERIDRQAEQRQQIADFVAFEQTAEVKHGDAARLERRGDLIQPRVRPAEDGLVAQRHALLFQFADGCRDPLGFVIDRVEAPQIGTLRARSRGPRSSASGSIPRMRPFPARRP